MISTHLLAKTESDTAIRRMSDEFRRLATNVTTSAMQELCRAIQILRLIITIATSIDCCALNCLSCWPTGLLSARITTA
ncbi:hypothetical protein TNCV_4956661 [Trichonephila clavipes]|nr:hypothetical protein TNCV_4956661 [Trichonephila clavipes]